MASKILVSILTSTVLFTYGQVPTRDNGRVIRCESTDLKRTENNKESSEFDEFIPIDHALLFQATGDLNLDGIVDKIIILNKKGEDTISTIEHPVKRNLLILLGQADKSFKLECQNENIIYPYNHSLNYKDAFVDVEINSGKFSIRHYGGVVEHWLRTTTFEYNSSDKTWYLFEDEVSPKDESIMKEKEQIRSCKNIGKVSVIQFDIYKKL